MDPSKAGRTAAEILGGTMLAALALAACGSGPEGPSGPDPRPRGHRRRRHVPGLRRLGPAVGGGAGRGRDRRRGGTGLADGQGPGGSPTWGASSS